MAICDFDTSNGASISAPFGGNKKNNNKHLPNGRINIHSIPDPSLRRLLLALDENIFKTADDLKETTDVLDPITPYIKKITPHLPEIASKVETLVKIIEKVDKGEWHGDEDGDEDGDGGGDGGGDGDDGDKYSNCVVMCKVTGSSTSSKDFMSYNVDLYENGVDAGKTGSGKLYIAELALGATIPIGTYILGHKHYVTETGGNE